MNDFYFDSVISGIFNEASLEVEQLVNDLKTQSLLDEYALMLEAAGEDLAVISKTDRFKARAKEVADKVIDRIVAALKAFKEKVFSALDKALVAFQSKVNSARIKPLYIKYASNLKVFKKLHSVSDLGRFFADNISVFFKNMDNSHPYDIFKRDRFYMENPLEAGKDATIHTANEVYEHHVFPIEEAGNSSELVPLFTNGIETGFRTGWDMSFIQSYKEIVDWNIKMNMKDAKKVYEVDSTELLNSYSTMMKNNINVVHGYVKIWSKYIGECINIIRAMANDVSDKTVKFVEIK